MRGPALRRGQAEFGGRSRGRGRLRQDRRRIPRQRSLRKGIVFMQGTTVGNGQGNFGVGDKQARCTTVRIELPECHLGCI